MLQIVIPMAGAGRRFADAGYDTPKPLIPVRGVEMIRLVIDNLRPRRAHRFVFVCQREHLARFGLAEKLARWAPGCAVVPIDGLTDGPACTVLCARDVIDADTPLMIANSDQYVDIAIDDYLAAGDAPGCDGLIMTMTANEPKWSFVELDASGAVRRVAEKEPISDIATVGIYNYARAGSFLTATDAMIAADERVAGEFYVAPGFNRLVAEGQRISTYHLAMGPGGMHGLGTPADLQAFLALPARQRPPMTLGQTR